MMNKLTLINTIYAIEPVMVCATRFSPQKIILLREEDAPEEKLRAEELIRKTLGAVVEVETKITSLYDVVRIAKDVVDIIEVEHARSNEIIVNVSGGRKPQAFGALFGAYARKDMVKQVVYVTEEDQSIIEFPLLGFGISDTKRMILEEIEKGELNVKNLAIKVGISKGMIYSHLRELKDLGFVDKDMRITTAGRLAIL